jgi:hypothetical protein
MTERFRRGLALALAGAALALAGPARAADAKLDTAAAASDARLKTDIFFLAGPECEGRGVDTQGINKAADYIAENFKKAGLKPGGVNGTYFQPFTISAGSPKLGDANALALQGPGGKTVTLELNKSFQPQTLTASGKLTAPVVFAGYGISSDNPPYDDYAGLDVAGKIVVVVRKSPKLFSADQSEPHAPLVVKAENALKHKAAGVLFVNDAKATGDALLPFRPIGTSPASGKLFVLAVTRAAVDEMLPEGQKLADLEAAIDKDNRPHSQALAGWTASLEAQVEQPVYKVKNVIGYLDGAGPHADEAVVVGAHYDHLGPGNYGSLGGPSARGKTHFGADDNGSGSTSVMELARRFGAVKDRQGRKLVFMTFSGEERGLLGSRYFCNDQPLVPLKSIVAMVNLDMVGRVRPDPETNLEKVEVGGTGTAKEFDGLIDELAKKHRFTVKKTPGGVGPSDHASFYLKEVPVFFFFSGYHNDYHRPTDTPDKINIEGMRHIVELSEDLIRRLATESGRPQFVKAAGGNPTLWRSGGGSDTARPETRLPRLGIMPDYDSKDGLVVADVIPGGAAEKAGVKKGDRIVEIGGRPVKDVTGYMAEMARQKPGQEFELNVVRDGKPMTLKATPQ